MYVCTIIEHVSGRSSMYNTVYHCVYQSKSKHGGRSISNEDVYTSIERPTGEAGSTYGSILVA